MSAITVAVVVDEEELNALVAFFGAEAKGGKKPNQLGAIARVGLRIVAASITEPGTCMVCGCTEDDCEGCVEKTGAPCRWINERRTVCSACL